MLIVSPGAEATPADFPEAPLDDLAGADDDEMEGSLQATDDKDSEQAQMAEDAAKGAKLYGLLGLTSDELMHELASAGGAVELRAAVAYPSLLNTAISNYDVRGYLLRLAALAGPYDA
eukprot:jgi/Tetstr1/435869/TSEL_024757.t1